MSRQLLTLFSLPYPFFLFTTPAPTDTSPLSLHDALPIYSCLESPLERDGELDIERGSDGSALLEDRSQELDHLRQGAQLSERGPGQGRHGIEGNVPDQLQPDLVAKALLDRTLEPAGNEGF